MVFAMKMIFFVLVAFLVLPRLVASEETLEKAKLVYARIAYSPMQTVAERLLILVYQRAKVEMVITQLPAKRASFEAQTGQVDGEILRIESYGDDKQNLYRIPYPLATVKTRLYVHKDHQHIDIKNLRNYKVAVVKGVKHSNEFVKGFPYIYYFSDVNIMMKQLNRGKVDIAVSNEINARYELKRMPNNVRELDYIAKYQGAYHYINKDYVQTIKKVEHVISEMTKSGELDEMWNLYEEELINSN